MDILTILLILSNIFLIFLCIHIDRSWREKCIEYNKYWSELMQQFRNELYDDIYKEEEPNE